MTSASNAQPARAGAIIWKIGWTCRKLALSAIGFTLLSAGAVVMLAVAAVTLFQTRRFYAEVMAKGLGRMFLRLWGIRVTVHADQPFPERQTIYISNHTSTLDLFVLVALGLPNTRFFLSGFVRKIIPLGVIGYLIGIFWTAPQEYPQKRIRCFQAAERTLRRTGESVFLSPEGERVTTGLIGHFNKGAFHLATQLGVPIVPFYIQIPRASDPGTGLDARPGTIHVYVKPAISTRGWKLIDLEENRDRVRDLFIRLHEELKPA
jgi:1-acyl-sn-glycerol-3-phosphate acyltransferase